MGKPQAMITFRSPVESDKPILLEWILADEDHKGMDPDFFFRQDALAMVIGDLSGPGLYVRLDSEPPDSVRLHIQFGENRVKSAKTLLKAWGEFRTRILAAGVRRIVFESHSYALIGFCCRCFGFRQVGDTADYELIMGGN